MKYQWDRFSMIQLQVSKIPIKCEFTHKRNPQKRTKVSYLCGQALACTIVEEKLDNFQVVLLGCHIQRCETILQNTNLNVCSFLKLIDLSTVLMILYVSGNAHT